MANRYLDSPAQPSLEDWPSVWRDCCHTLQDELPAQQFNTWVRPLQPGYRAVGPAGETGGAVLVDASSGHYPDGQPSLLAPNRFMRDWVADKFLPRIAELVEQLMPGYTLHLEAHDTVPTQGAAGPAPDVEAKQHSASNDWFERRRSQSPQQPHGHLPGAGSASPEIFSELYSAGEDTGPVLNDEERGIDSDYQGLLEIPQSSGQTLADPTGADDSNSLVLPSALSSTSSRHALNRQIAESDTAGHQHNLIEAYRFENFVEGKSNQLARAAASQVVENPGGSYNPLFLYGGVGLGKTHLMHAVGNELKRRRPGAKVVYLHSERFVADMVKALQLNAINDFKRFYRSVDALLIDDIQFFANKERSQEEFFHTFNALLEGGQQMILTCDRYPKEINGVEERLKSRFGWGLTVAVEPPELETRVAILMKKAEQVQMPIDHDAAFFLAQRVRSNVRELEGALKRVIATAHFTNSPITVELIKESLKDLLALQDKQVSLDNIQRTTAEYYKIKVADLMSKRRNRSVARPRQVAMALAKELTNHSLPEIGDAFGGRDHTTVLHACRKIKELRDTSSDIQEDYQNLLRTLAT